MRILKKKSTQQNELAQLMKVRENNKMEKGKGYVVVDGELFGEDCFNIRQLNYTKDEGLTAIICPYDKPYKIKFSSDYCRIDCKIGEEHLYDGCEYTNAYTTFDIKIHTLQLKGKPIFTIDKSETEKETVENEG